MRKLRERKCARGRPGLRKKSGLQKWSRQDTSSHICDRLEKELFKFSMVKDKFTSMIKENVDPPLRTCTGQIVHVVVMTAVTPPGGQSGN